MNPSDELIHQITHIAQEAAIGLLAKTGTVQPFGIMVIEGQGEPATYFPADQAPEAGFAQWLDSVTREVKHRVSEGDVRGFAIVTAMERGKEKVFAVQIEAAGLAFVLVYPYFKNPEGQWVVKEPQKAG